MNVKAAILILAVGAAACRTPGAAPQPPAAPASPASTAGEASASKELPAKLKQFPRTVIDYDRSLLNENERQVVAKLIEASKYMDDIFWLQVSPNNPEWRRRLAADPSKHAELEYFDIMKGPWDRLDHEKPFIPGIGAKPAGAGFYPADMTKEEFERWIAANPGDKEAFQGLFTIIRRQGDRLVAIPYSQAYRDSLVPAAQKLREAAAITTNASLRDYLTKRADAFLSDDYYASDIAWMDLEGPIEVVIGPYEVYEDELFNYKASFESFVTVVDRPESEKLVRYAAALPAMERHLPLPQQHKNPNRGTDSPIRVVQQIFTAGDARRGVQTAAFNLPNDERVRETKGSKKVLLKNVMEAKYRQSGHPVAQRVLDASQIGKVSFDAFFNHVLFHELAHGLGPGIITGPDGQKVENRILLKELYSTIEEAKSDVVGVWSLLFAFDNDLLTEFDRDELFATNAGLMFRSMRFGLTGAHGRGTAVQWNWYREKGAIVPTSGGRYRVDMSKYEEATRSLAEELLMIEATGDYDRAKRLLDRYGVTNAEIDGINTRLADIPVDIAPVFAAAGEK
jgi:hypothetical protein